MECEREHRDKVLTAVGHCSYSYFHSQLIGTLGSVLNLSHCGRIAPLRNDLRAMFRTLPATPFEQRCSTRSSSPHNKAAIATNGILTEGLPAFKEGDEMFCDTCGKKFLRQACFAITVAR